MKKIALLVMALFTLSTATAQIQSTGTAPRSETVYGPRAGVWLNRMELNGEWSYYLAMVTTNQFDDHMHIVLGNLENTKLSLKWFIDNFKLGTVYNMKDDIKIDFRGLCMSVLATDCYEFYKDGYAGCARVRVSEFNKMLTRLNEIK